MFILPGKRNAVKTRDGENGKKKKCEGISLSLKYIEAVGKGNQPGSGELEGFATFSGEHLVRSVISPHMIQYYPFLSPSVSIL